MLRRILLAVLGGLLIWLALPDHDLWFLAFPGVAALSLSCVGLRRVRTGALLGFVGGLAMFLPVLHWSGIYVGNVPWLALSIVQASYLMIVGAGLAVLQRCPGRVSVLGGAALWVAAEALRGSWPFGGFPWARLAFSQADSPLLHLASIAGAPGVSFVVAVVGGALAALVYAFAQRRGWVGEQERDRADAQARRPLRAWVRVAGPAVAASAVLVGAIWWPTPTNGRPVTVAGIQGNVPTAGLEFNAQRRAVLDNHVSLTRQVATDAAAGRVARPDLVIWPENSSDIDPTRNDDAALAIDGAVRAVGVPVIVGAVLQEPADKVSNTALLYEPGRGITARYVKQHPVPFAEYIPYRGFFRTFSDKVDLVTKDFAHGPRTEVFQVPTRAGTVPVAPLICFEVAYDGLTRDAVTAGAQLLAVPTNNATFGFTAESAQQLAISRFRAVEHGRSVVHISTVGQSALITPDGVAHHRTSLFTRAAVVDQLPLRSELTLADRWGRAPELVVVVAGLGAVLLAWMRSRRGRTARVPPVTNGADVEGPR